MKYGFLRFSILYILSVCVLSQANAQDPDGWEDYQNRLQPPETVLEAIRIKEDMIHQMEFYTEAGNHTLTLVDAEGNILLKDFEIVDI